MVHPNQLNATNARIIENTLGTFVEVDLTNDGQIGYLKSLKLHVNIPIEKPSSVGFNNKMVEGTT